MDIKEFVTYLEFICLNNQERLLYLLMQSKEEYMIRDELALYLNKKFASPDYEVVREWKISNMFPNRSKGKKGDLERVELSFVLGKFQELNDKEKRELSYLTENHKNLEPEIKAEFVKNAGKSAFDLVLFKNCEEREDIPFHYLPSVVVEFKMETSNCTQKYRGKLGMHWFKESYWIYKDLRRIYNLKELLAQKYDWLDYHFFEVLTIVHVSQAIPTQFCELNSEYGRYNNPTKDPIAEIHKKLIEVLDDEEFAELCIEMVHIPLGEHWGVVPVDLYFFVIYEKEKSESESLSFPY